MSRAQHVNLNNAFSEASTKRPTPAQKTEDPEDEDVDSSSEASFDEEQVNRRTVPYWPKYRTVLKQRGFRLDTVRDVETRHGYKAASDCIRYLSSHNRNSCDGIYHDDALCPDVGLVSNDTCQCCSYCAQTSLSLIIYSVAPDCATTKGLS